MQDSGALGGFDEKEKKNMLQQKRKRNVLILS